MSRPITRLAPSPTGALHLGNARTFVINYLLARQRDWRVLMRIEDLDSPRTKLGAAEGMLDDLRWLGLDWEPEMLQQSGRAEVYLAALDRLIKAGAVYPCTCSRKDIELASSAPHAEDGVSIYPRTCRNDPPAGSPWPVEPVNWRVRTDDAPIAFEDAFHGRREMNLAEICGDFVVFRKNGLAAYQLAVVVDDEESGVNRIVRGEDLLDSTPRQILLRRLLELGDPEPAYWHVPLVIGPDGKRLAKRHGDTRLRHYRELGASAERMLGLLGYWCGVLDTRRETTMDELVKRFDLARLSHEAIVFTDTDEHFLVG